MQVLAQRFADKFYADNRPRVALLGINPGWQGMARTGVAFTEPMALSEIYDNTNDLPRGRPELSTQFGYRMVEALGGPMRGLPSFFPQLPLSPRPAEPGTELQPIRLPRPPQNPMAQPATLPPAAGGHFRPAPRYGREPGQAQRRVSGEAKRRAEIIRADCGALPFAIPHAIPPPEVRGAGGEVCGGVGKVDATFCCLAMWRIHKHKYLAVV